jgi:hypothetical protein
MGQLGLHEPYANQFLPTSRLILNSILYRGSCGSRISADAWPARVSPNTDGLSGSGVALDAKGFVLTGGDCNESRNLLETSRRGIFAIGDVRSGSIKRVAAAVGEGAQVVATLHAYLATAERNPAVSRAE